MAEEQLETTGLRILEDISTLILKSHDLPDTLDNIVHLVAKRIGTDVCSIYLLEEDGRTLRLAATKGLLKSSVGKITMKTSEGLAGLVIETGGMVTTDKAPLHPRYKYFPETREERFNSFLGIPLMLRELPMGVIVIQTREARTFRQEEVSTLTTIAYQISSIVINAKLLDSIRLKEAERERLERELEKFKAIGTPAGGEPPADKRKRDKRSLLLMGTPVSAGFSRGRAVIIDRRNEHDGMGVATVRSRAEERTRLQTALEKAKIETICMEKRVAELLSKEDAAIFHTHLMILEDRGFLAKVHDLIEQDYGAVRAVNEVVAHYVNAFSQMEDPYLKERSADMEDIRRRIIAFLDGSGHARLRLREKRILVAHEILPSDMATLDHEKLLGIVTEKGDKNSHAAIMAKSLGIPAVVGVEGIHQKLGLRDEVIVDGNSGRIYINPSEKVKGEYERLEIDFGIKRRELEELRDLPAVTRDGVAVALKANIGLLSDIRVALANGAEGVGLYRTEFPYMTRSAFPTRSELVGLYRKVLEGFAPHPVTIRTLDIGGDKTLPYFPMTAEDNPFMGWRSIRVSLEREDIFRVQLAGILLASPHGKVKIMFPMVSSIAEIWQVKKILGEVREELAHEGQTFDPDISFGIMVELPAAVQTAHILVNEVDFFSIGTNDLIQYTMAADRNNPKVRRYYDSCQPAVLHSIKRVEDVALAANKPASVCGEMAADPVMAVLLAGMGIRELSLSAPAIPVVKKAIRSVDIRTAREMADRTLSLVSSGAVRTYLAEAQNALGI
ncbi:phosphoenolpyruvate--protein phosphotransferase [Geobacter hydrogenophilus]|uniref:phosphoenolpyruvate--protein phosphotransferase n=1 Tax=Geobacter hydrogenophilus TaxID=40983 RepID=A0A9W6LE77_9BACT|nr:phosphoenolpyruvate--protein phosphotransferase [Geobacter hydrogenophilus]GLI39750.1 phosphoenolpyruvate--protein phosphotransferase [Geobacter hydrogenophilus]